MQPSWCNINFIPHLRSNQHKSHFTVRTPYNFKMYVKRKFHAHQITATNCKYSTLTLCPPSNCLDRIPMLAPTQPLCDALLSNTVPIPCSKRVIQKKKKRLSLCPKHKSRLYDKHKPEYTFTDPLTASSSVSQHPRIGHGPRRRRQ